MSMDVSIDAPKTKVRIVADENGGVVITHTPKDFVKDGAAEVEIDRSRRDDGSVDITIRPK